MITWWLLLFDCIGYTYLPCPAETIYTDRAVLFCFKYFVRHFVRRSKKNNRLWYVKGHRKKAFAHKKPRNRRRCWENRKYGRAPVGNTNPTDNLQHIAHQQLYRHGNNHAGSNHSNSLLGYGFNIYDTICGFPFVTEWLTLILNYLLAIHYRAASWNDYIVVQKKDNTYWSLRRRRYIICCILKLNQ